MSLGVNGELSDGSPFSSLREAARLILSSVQVLAANRSEYQATNLPVADAVDHVVACLGKDADYLKRLAEICEESALLAEKFGK